MSRKKTKTGACHIPQGEASSRIKDLTRHPEEDVRGLGHCPETRAEADRIAAIAAEHGEDFLGRYDLRDVKIDEFVRAIEKGIPDAKLAVVLRSCVTEPLAAILARFVEADGELMKLRDGEVRGMYRDHVVDEGQRNMRALLAAFAKNIADLKTLVHEFTGIRDMLQGLYSDAVREINRAAELVQTLQAEAQGLSGLLAEHQRTLESNGFRSTDACVKVLQAIDARRTVFQGAFAAYIKITAKHEALVRQAAEAYDRVRDAERREMRLSSAIRNREEFFREAQVDPFTLIGETVREISAAREIRECREFLKTALPDVPLFTERGILGRAEDLSARIERERERLTPAPAPLRAMPPPEGRAADSAGAAVPLELAVCAFAAFCKRHSALSGRTPRVVWEKVLVKQALAGGCTFEVFFEGVLSAERQALLKRFEMQSGRGGRVAHVCFRPTPEGFQAAEAWFSHFPPDFAERVRAGVAALHASQRKFYADIMKTRETRAKKA